jgi:hypothetical protein
MSLSIAYNEIQVLFGLLYKQQQEINRLETELSHVRAQQAPTSVNSDRVRQFEESD